MIASYYSALSVVIWRRETGVSKKSPATMSTAVRMVVAGAMSGGDGAGLRRDGCNDWGFFGVPSAKT